MGAFRGHLGLLRVTWGLRKVTLGFKEVTRGFFRSFQGSKRSLWVLGGPHGTSKTHLSTVRGDWGSMNDLSQFQVFDDNLGLLDVMWRILLVILVMLDSWRSLQGYERSLWTFGGSHHQNQLRPLRHLFGPLVAPFRPYRGRLRPQRSNMES